MKMDLSKLTKTQKIELINLLERKEQFLKQRKAKYKPHKGQLEIHVSEALERYVFCGNGFGKTTMLVNEVHWAATGYNPLTNKSTEVPAKICLLFDDPYKIDDFLIEYRNWNIVKPESLSKQGKPYYTMITYDNGSTVTAISHQVEPLKLEGSQWTHIFADEPPPQKVYNATFRGGRIKGRPLKTLLVGTPVTQTWLRTEVYEPFIRGELDNVECFRGESAQNQDNLDPNWLSRFSAKLSEHEKLIRLKGEFFDLEGQALAHLFDMSTHVVKRNEYYWNTDDPVVVALDPHPEKNHVACILGVDRDDYMIYLDELSLKLTPRDYARALKDWYRKYRVLDIVCDSLGSAQYTGGEGFKSFIEVLREEGINVRSTSYDEKKDDQFIQRIQDALVLPEKENNFGQKIPKLRIMDHCHGIINDIRNVSWVRNKAIDENKPKLEISNRDYLACLKYALAANIHYKKGKTKVYRKELPQTYGFNIGKKKRGDSWDAF